MSNPYKVGKESRGMSHRPKSLKKGDRFGRLELLYEAEPIGYIEKKSGKLKYKHIWHCLCDCGNEKNIDEKLIKNGSTRSCGCLRAEITSRKHKIHGMTKTRLYQIYAGMLARCYNPNNKQYKNYGGRGITVCDEWKNDFQSFSKWSYENGYNDIPYMNGGFSIDRMNNDEGYTPKNCRWATRIMQNNNTRANKFITANGETHTLAEWGRITGLGQSVIGCRIRRYGFSPEEAIIRKDFRRRENKHDRADV